MGNVGKAYQTPSKTGTVNPVKFMPESFAHPITHVTIRLPGATYLRGGVAILFVLSYTHGIVEEPQSESRPARL
jgi:hypothetical protein